jgi:hypothetical protein
MSACHSKCDCDYDPDPERGGHQPDCRSQIECDEHGYCDKHYAEAEAQHAYLKDVPRHMVINDEQSREELERELRDAGRGHLVKP